MPYPKSWGAKVFAKTFSEGDEEPSGMRAGTLDGSRGEGRLFLRGSVAAF